jgi:hypothetical protein
MNLCTPNSTRFIEVQVKSNLTFLSFLPLSVHGAPSTQEEVANNSSISPLLLTHSLLHLSRELRYEMEVYSSSIYIVSPCAFLFQVMNELKGRGPPFIAGEEEVICKSASPHMEGTKPTSTFTEPRRHHHTDFGQVVRTNRPNLGPNRATGVWPHPGWAAYAPPSSGGSLDVLGQAHVGALLKFFE